MKKIIIIALCLILTTLCGCIFYEPNSSNDQPNVTVDGEFSITNGYNHDGYCDGVKLKITSVNPENAVLDIGEVKVELLTESGDLASTWYQGKIAQIDFYQQVSFSNIYDCVDDKDTLDKGDWITFWFKDGDKDYEPTLDGYTINLTWKGQKIFSKIINFSELEFEN